MNGDAKIFEWVPSALAWLNLSWSPEGLDYHISVIQKASKLLAVDPGYWSAVIRDDNWRAPLVGCACVLVSKNRSFFEDLCYRFTSGSMVAPQIGVAIGLVHQSEAVPFFKAQLDVPATMKDPRRFVSAQTALARLGVLKESEITFGRWSPSERDYAGLAQNVVSRHWNFWSTRV